MWLQMIDKYVKCTDGEMFRLADVEHWIFECGRYLFHSKIRLHDSDMCPSMCYHPIATIENLMKIGFVEIDNCIAIHQLFQKISKDWWTHITVNEIENAQSNLLMLLKNVKMNAVDEYGD